MTCKYTPTVAAQELYSKYITIKNQYHPDEPNKLQPFPATTYYTQTELERQHGLL